MAEIAQVDYKRIAFNACSATDLAEFPDMGRSYPTGYIFAAWFHTEPATAGYGASLVDAIADLFRKTDKV